MTRKGTIIIAVLVNACLLILLFITATTSEEEILLDNSSTLHPPVMHQEIALQKPLFDEPETSNQLELPPISTTSQPAAKPEPKQIVTKESDESITHKLPKIEGAKPEKVEVAKAEKKQPAKVVEQPKKIVAATGYKTITVKKGDTLERIAKRHGSTVKDIISMNHLPSTFLRIGQVLKIPQANVAKSAEPKVHAAKSDAYYVVQPGDNPWTIAMKHHMKVNDLLKLNHLDEKKAKRLKPGDRLRIR